jgi:hypothetical protein
MSQNPFGGMGRGVAGSWAARAFGFNSQHPVVQAVIAFGTIVALTLFIGREVYEIAILSSQNNKTKIESDLAPRSVEANTGKTEAERKIADDTARYALEQAKSNAEKTAAEARQAEAMADKAIAERDNAIASTRATKMQACKTQAEALVASGINQYDVPSFLDKECVVLLDLKNL